MTAIVPTMSFEDRIKQRVKDGIGELLSDEDLSKIIHAGVKSAFFDIRVQRDNRGYDTKTDPPLINEILQGLLREQVRENVKAWIDAHPEEVSKTIDDVLKAGIVKIMTDAIDQVLQGPLWALKNSMFQQGLLKSI